MFFRSDGRVWRWPDQDCLCWFKEKGWYSPCRPCCQHDVYHWLEDQQATGLATNKNTYFCWFFESIKVYSSERCFERLRAPCTDINPPLWGRKLKIDVLVTRPGGRPWTKTWTTASPCTTSLPEAAGPSLGATSRSMARDTSTKTLSSTCSGYREGHSRAADLSTLSVKCFFSGSQVRLLTIGVRGGGK